LGREKKTVDKLALHREIVKLGEQWKARRDEQLVKQRLNLSEQAGQLELAKTIRPSRARKGSILDQFSSGSAGEFSLPTEAEETGFGSITTIDAAAAGPGSPDAWRHLMASQYPTIPAMHDVPKPQFGAEPSHWNAPSNNSTLEARYLSALRGLDPGPSQSIPEALGFKAFLGALAKGIKHPALKAVYQACEDFGKLMGDVHKAHYDNVCSLQNAHSAAMDAVLSTAGAKALHKAHAEHMAGIHKEHLDKVSGLHQRFGKAMTDALAKIDAQGQYHGESIAEPPAAPDFVN
jgi:hypothetical protein